MEDQNNTLDKRELTSQERVEEKTEADGCDDEESQMPALRHIVWVVEDDKAGDLLRDEEGDGGVADLPAEDAEPAYDVGEKFLGRDGCEF